ncbi:DUF421 domain-containing protein [Bacillus songklensis]|uniref:DUF421 domain-containing protein n=1 Tax=Bacillus songklensis TaxID=1069116 RepID=A0ABV8B7M8_9BACI
MNEMLESVIRTTVAFFMLMAVVNIMGKTTSAQLSYYNFALSITLGSIAANVGFDIKIDFIPMIASFISLSIIAYTFAVLSKKSRYLRKWISGKPTVVIENGKILEKNMNKLNYTLDMLSQSLREKDIFNIGEVEYAVLENNGKLSVLKKALYRNPTKEDLGMFDFSKSIIPLEIIMDRQLVEKNLTSQYSKEWILNQLKNRNLKMEEVNYAVVGTNGQLYIDCYKDYISSPVDVE